MSSNLHKSKLSFFCRICGEKMKSPSQRGDRVLKSTTEDMVMGYYNDDFKADNESEHPDKVCSTCYYKLKGWKEQKKKYDKHKKRNLENNIQFQPNCSLPDNLQLGHLPCSSDGNCKVCKNEIYDSIQNVEPSPSKFQKLTEQPIVSPSDVLKKSHTLKSNVQKKARRSILLEKTEAKCQSEGDTERIKIYVSDNVFDVNQCVDSEVAVLFACSICSHVPKDPCKITACQHIVCHSCVSNYKSQTKSSKCPFQDCKQVYNDTQIKPLSGRDRSVFNSLKVNCSNISCKFQCPILQLDEHSKTCRKRGAYKEVGLRGKRSNFINSKIKDIKESVEKNCKESKIDVTENSFSFSEKVLEIMGMLLIEMLIRFMSVQPARLQVTTAGTLHVQDPQLERRRPV